MIPYNYDTIYNITEYYIIICGCQLNLRNVGYASIGLK